MIGPSVLTYRFMTPENHRRVLEILRSFSADASHRERWSAFPRPLWPALFHLVDLAADLPRLSSNTTFTAFPGALWPDLGEVRRDLLALQDLTDHPAVPAAARTAPEHGLAQFDRAVRELEDSHCVHVDFLLGAEDRAALEAEVAKLAETKLGSWGELERGAAPAVHEIFDRALASERFGSLTGFEPGRDEHTLTLSLQDLAPEGIGWHRDLYWPKEWVGEDVFAVLYALGSDSPERGGAFLHYVPWRNELYAHYRREHQATVMWNSADSDGRLIHAVSEYLTPATSRHLIILQCHRH